MLNSTQSITNFFLSLDDRQKQINQQQTIFNNKLFLLKILEFQMIIISSLFRNIVRDFVLDEITEIIALNALL